MDASPMDRAPTFILQWKRPGFCSRDEEWSVAGDEASILQVMTLVPSSCRIELFGSDGQRVKCATRLVPDDRNEVDDA